VEDLKFEFAKHISEIGICEVLPSDHLEEVWLSMWRDGSIELVQVGPSISGMKLIEKGYDLLQ
jgi:hypothetical protein